MRPGQNKRMRGRPTNNRRGPNPLTRSYESNGPDVKIRGNAHHVAEKYLQLARDAHTGGDPVASGELLAARRTLLSAYCSGAGGAGARTERSTAATGRTKTTWTMTAILAGCRIVSPRPRSGRPTFPQPQQGFQPQPNAAPNAPQPFVERPAYEGERQGGGDRGGFAPRQDRQGNRFQDRGPRPDRPSRIATIKTATMRVIATIDRDATVARGISGPIAIPSPAAAEPAADAAAPAGLPSFITASPRPNNRGSGSERPVTGYACRAAGRGRASRAARGCSRGL